MPSGLAVELPLVVDNTFGPYNLITDFESLATQNLKMLVLTNPGERMMDINFGVGLRRYLFQPRVDRTFGEIKTRILEQVGIYLPYIKIESVDFFQVGETPDEFPNDVKVKIFFKIVPLQISSGLEVDVSSNIS